MTTEIIDVGIIQMTMTSELTDVEGTGTWGCNLERIFIDIMVDEVNKGNMAGGIFNPNTWRRMLFEVNSQGKRNFNLKQLKQKFNRLRATHREFSDLLKQTGFCWDAETNSVTALDETWKNYIQVIQILNHSIILSISNI